MTTLPTFLPLIAATDRIPRKPIAPWKKSLAVGLMNFVNKDLGHNPVSISGYLNQLSLIEATQGNDEIARKLCEAQILFWRNFAEKSGNKISLTETVQPWINLARLNRWQSKFEQASSFYSALAPWQRDKPCPLLEQYGVQESLAELCAIDAQQSITKLLDGIFWSEFGRQLLDHGSQEDFLRHVQAGLRLPLSGGVKAALLELSLIRQARQGKYSLASLEKLIGRNRSDIGSTFEMLRFQIEYHCQHDNRDTLLEQVWNAISSETFFKRNASGLAQIDAHRKIFQSLGLPQEELQLLERQVTLAIELDDEPFLFAAKLRQAELNGASALANLRTSFADSGYLFIRKAIGLSKVYDPSSEVILEAVQSLSQLKLKHCADVLHCQFVENDLAVTT